MKKLALSVLTVLALGSCASGPSGELPSDDVVRDFAEGLETQDIELLMSAYHEDAIFVFTAPNGREDVLEGKDAIRAGQLGSFGDSRMSVLTEDWTKKTSGDEIVYQFVVEFNKENLSLLNTLTLSLEENEWGIIHQTVAFILPE